MLLGPVHRGVGVSEQRLGRATVRDRDPDAGGDDGLETVEVERVARDAQQPVGERVGVLDAVELLADDDELVAAEPGDEITGAQRLVEAATHLDEEAVSGVVADAVVEDLEPVEVEEEHGDIRAALPLVATDPAEPFEAPAPGWGGR